MAKFGESGRLFIRRSVLQTQKQITKKILPVLLDKALYLRVVLHNDHPYLTHYDYGLLKDLIAALESNTQN